MQTHATPHEAETEWLEVRQGERFAIRTSATATNGAYLTLEVAADSGNGVPVHIHENEEEHFIIVEGMARILNGDRMLDLPVGSAATIGKGVRHA
ncbi:MAG TPA: hypothetical protein VM689_01460 [Aliidongia sp.]|nr:hypothetical protein [Aliidongia sp.]